MRQIGGVERGDINEKAEHRDLLLLWGWATYFECGGVPLVSKNITFLVPYPLTIAPSIGSNKSHDDARLL